MHRSADGPPGGAARLVRFDGVERTAHWATAVLVLVLVATGVILYVPALSLAVGRRLLVEDVHVFTGVCVFVPLGLSTAGPWGRHLRRDLTALGRMTAGERVWLRSLGRRQRGSLEKFNPGQKLNAAALGGLLGTLLVTGVILRWGTVLPVSWRTGATFVHDWFALAISVLLLGHLILALSHPPALGSMVHGRIPSAWLERHAPRWKPADWERGDSSPTPDVHAVPAAPPWHAGAQTGEPAHVADH